MYNPPTTVFDTRLVQLKEGVDWLKTARPGQRLQTRWIDRTTNYPVFEITSDHSVRHVALYESGAIIVGPPIPNEIIPQVSDSSDVGFTRQVIEYLNDWLDFEYEYRGNNMPSPR